MYGICNVVGASIPRNTDSGTYIHVGPEIGVASTKAFTGQVTVLMLLALCVGQMRGTVDDATVERIVRELKNILKDILVEVYHIGSTAVKGLAAKSIIDIMPVVTNISLVDKHNKEFVAIGYECMGEFGIEGRRYFRKGGDNRTHQIHIFEQSNHKDINRHIAVRDFLRTHPDIALEYGELKMELAYRFSEDIEGYCTGKDAFVKQLEKDALLWYQNNESYKTR